MTLGRLHLCGLTLAPGAGGLYCFYGQLFPFVPRWAIWAVLFLPWLVVHTITFCKVPPFGLVPFRRCLLGVVCAYASLAATAEAVQFVRQLPPYGKFPLVLARVLMYFGCLGCVPIAREYLDLRKIEPTARD